MSATYALADTSVFVARETGRSMASPLPRNVFISPVTLAELSLGVLASRDDATRARRLATLTVASRYTVLAPDRIVASVWSQMMTEIAKAGRPMPKSRVNDAWIAATARLHDLPKVTAATNHARCTRVRRRLLSLSGSWSWTAEASVV